MTARFGSRRTGVYLVLGVRQVLLGALDRLVKVGDLVLLDHHLAVRSVHLTCWSAEEEPGLSAECSPYDLGEH